jgi:hypothetical protein
MHVISIGQLNSVVNALKGVLLGKLGAAAITTTLDATTTNAQVPGAKAVYDFIANAVAGVSKIAMTVVTELPEVGDPNVIYLVASDSDTYIQHVYIGGQWYDLGSTSVDLSNYWSKTDLEVATDEEVQAVIDGITGG